jgi:hypothetical protein
VRQRLQAKRALSERVSQPCRFGTGCSAAQRCVESEDKVVSTPLGTGRIGGRMAGFPNTACRFLLSTARITSNLSVRLSGDGPLKSVPMGPPLSHSEAWLLASESHLPASRDIKGGALDYLGRSLSYLLSAPYLRRISMVRSMGSASTVRPRPRMVVARNSEL